MPHVAVLDQLLAFADLEAQIQWLQANEPLLTEPLVRALKDRAVQLRLTNPQSALQLAALINKIADQTHQPLYRGYGLWAEAVVRNTGLGEFLRALHAYDEAIAIFKAQGDALGPALMQISRIWALSNLNRLDEAFADGEEAATVLHAHEQWIPLASLTLNLGGMYSRLGDDKRALHMYEEAQLAYVSANPEMPPEVEAHWALATHNRSMALCYMGRLDEAEEASQAALAVQQRLGNSIEVARVQQHMGVIHFLRGRYNLALQLFEKVSDVFIANQLHRHVARLDLYVADCLLYLRRFQNVLVRCRRAFQLFSELGAVHEQGIAKLCEAAAFSGLGQFDEALIVLEEAHSLFEKERNEVWLALADLEKANIFSRQTKYAESAILSEQCAQVFRRQDLTVKEIDTYLNAARAQVAQNQNDKARQLLDQIRQVGDDPPLNHHLYQIHHLAGKIAMAGGASATAKAEFQQAIDLLEQIRTNLMVEFRVSFQEDKQEVYEDMVALCIARKEISTAFEYVERAKSRALLDLMANQADLQIRARNEADRPLVEELILLRRKHEQLHRLLVGSQHRQERSWSLQSEDPATQSALLTLERQIANLWHRLLVRNADYASAHSLWHIRLESVDAYLEEDCLILEYFQIREHFVVFVKSATGLYVEQLPTPVSQIRAQVERLGRHMETVPKFIPQQSPALRRQAQFLLSQLYTMLIAPIASLIGVDTKLIIVPHGILHYVPFHALYDGQTYFVEQHELSYLPNASLLHYCRLQQSAPTGLLAVGYSAAGDLPYAPQEAQLVANIFAGEVLVEEQATVGQIQRHAHNKQLLHLATHAIFHADQPLFSGLILEDHWLTTLDIFNLELDAALVTLSACETGLSVIGGGDELLGLMRAFLYAGAASLVLSLWPIQDRSTMEFMQIFYTQLATGRTKSAALRQAQLHFIRGTDAQAPDYTHPYFWAPFFLIGDNGVLGSRVAPPAQ